MKITHRALAIAPAPGCTKAMSDASPSPHPTREDFAGIAGESLQWTLHDQRLPVVVETVDDRPNPGPEGRQAFSVSFRVATAHTHAQGMARLDHPQRGPLEVFVVPVGQEGDAILYEAVFN